MRSPRSRVARIGAARGELAGTRNSALKQSRSSGNARCSTDSGSTPLRAAKAMMPSATRLALRNSWSSEAPSASISLARERPWGRVSA